MQPTQNTIEEIFDAYLALVGTNIEAWSELLTEDAIMEQLLPLDFVPAYLNLFAKPKNFEKAMSDWQSMSAK